MNSRSLVSWIVAMAAMFGGATIRAQGLVAECAPSSQFIESQVAWTRKLCEALVQSDEHPVSDLGRSVTVLLDRDNTPVVLQGPYDGGSWIPQGVEGGGSEGDSLFWGRWVAGPTRIFHDEQRVESLNAVGLPFVGGLPTTARLAARMGARPTWPLKLFPEGSVTYELLGDAGIVSGKDVDGAAVAIGAVSAATLTVDFDAGTAELHLVYTVRGVTGTLDLSLLKLSAPLSATFEQGECVGKQACPVAQVRFYGLDARRAGLIFRLRHDQHMPEASWVATRLANVWAHGAVALAQRP